MLLRYCFSGLLLMASYVASAQYIGRSDYIPLDVTAHGMLIANIDDYSAGVVVEYGFGYYVQHGLRAGVSYRSSALGESDLHAFERGDGLGGSIGYRYYQKAPTHGLLVGANAAAWQMEYEHIDISGLASFTEFSELTRLYAYLEVGYRWLSTGGLQAEVSLGYGTDRTVWLQSDDEPVRERWSPSLQISAGWKF